MNLKYILGVLGQEILIFWLSKRAIMAFLGIYIVWFALKESVVCSKRVRFALKDSNHSNLGI